MKLDDHPLSIAARPPTPTAWRGASWIGIGALALLLGAAALRVYSKTRHSEALAAQTAQDAVRHVQTTRPAPRDAKRKLSLPGTLQGQREAPIYARASGYLQRWTRDIGEQVRQGELLAVIDAPEAEQELQQASAAVEQIRARVGLAESSLQRWETMRKLDAVPQQELDERRATRQQAGADLLAAQANVRRLEQLRAFRRVTAPFAGTIVRRNVDVGALIGAGNNGASRELFYLAQTDQLRIDVAVPQIHTGAVRPGQEVSIKLLERGGAPLKGSVARTAGAIDSASRSMQVEIKLANPDGKLLPGAYVEVSLPLANPVRHLVVPVAALQFRKDGPRVALVQADARGVQRVRLRPVKLGRDFGRTLEVLDGVTAADLLVLNPHDAIEDGEPVRAAPPAT
jgi:RND family efflux transporter MFP subunit